MTDYPYDNPFARTLRELRAESGWTQLEAADHIGISRAYLSGLEGGSQTTRDKDTLHRIARTYNIAFEDLNDLAPKVNVLTVKARARRTAIGLDLPRDDRAKLDIYLDPELAEYYQHAATALHKDPDEVYTSFDLIPPDIIAWLRGNSEHVRMVRKLMVDDTTT